MMTLSAKISDRNVVFLILTIVLTLIFVVLGQRSIWVDEGFSIFVSKLPLKEIVVALADSDAHPPLHYFVLHLFLKFGSSELFLRIPSFISYLGSLYMISLIAEKVYNRRVALWSLYIAGINYFFLYWMLNIRMFCFVVFFSLCSHYFFLLLVDAPENKKIISLYILSSLCAVYSNYFVFLLFAAQFLYTIWEKKYCFLKSFLLAQFFVFLGFAPWLPSFLLQLFSGAGPDREILPTLNGAFYTALEFFSFWFLGIFSYLDLDRGSVFLQSFGTLSFVFTSLYGIIAQKSRSFFLALFSLLLFLCFFYVILKRPMIQTRYFVVIIPWFFLLLSPAVLFCMDKNKKLTCVFLAIYFFFNISSLYLSSVNPYYTARQDWRSAVKEADLRKGDGIVVLNSYQYFGLVYYLPLPPENYNIRSFMYPDTMYEIITLPGSMLEDRLVYFSSLNRDLEDPDFKILKTLSAKMNLVKAVRHESVFGQQSIDVITFEKKAADEKKR